MACHLQHKAPVKLGPQSGMQSDTEAADSLGVLYPLACPPEVCAAHHQTRPHRLESSQSKIPSFGSPQGMLVLGTKSNEVHSVAVLKVKSRSQ